MLVLKEVASQNVVSWDDAMQTIAVLNAISLWMTTGLGAAFMGGGNTTFNLLAANPLL